MKRKKIAKILTMLMTVTMVTGLCPSTLLAVTGSDVAKDGTYSATKPVVKDQEEDSEDEWTEYDVTVNLTVKDGKSQILLLHRPVDLNLKVKHF